MANLVIKPTTNNSLKIQDQGGTERISLNTSGELSLPTVTSGTITGATIGSGVTFPAGMPIKVTHFQDTNTQVVYGSTGYNYYNDTYTTNANQNTKLLIQYGIFYEMNSAGDTLQMAVSLDGTDIGVWQDTQNAQEYNIWTTSQTITSNLTKNTNYTIRLYIKSISGNVVIPRTGASPNWTLTITEIAI